MYNNDITYNKKWDTELNKKAHKELNEKYLDNTLCDSHIPYSWSVEVLEMVKEIDSVFGIERTTSSVGGYAIRTTILELLFISTIKNIWRELFFLLKPKSIKYRDDKGLWSRVNDFPKRLKQLTENSINSTLNVFKIKYINRFHNKINKPKVSISQIKEKYGTLRVYFSCHPAYEEYVERLVCETEVKLAMKGAYLPLESMWNSSVGYNINTNHRRDIISIKKVNEDGSVFITKTKYRQIMEDLGVDTSSMKSTVESKEI